MHGFQLVHKDIKPFNLVFSRRSKELVLVDFGVSSATSSPIGFKTLTFKEGTERFMSKEMKELSEEVPGPVDLYWNDAVALRTVLDWIRVGKTILYMGNFSVTESSHAIAEGRILRLAYSVYARRQYDEDDRQALALAGTRFGEFFP